MEQVHQLEIKLRVRPCRGFKFKYSRDDIHESDLNYMSVYGPMPHKYCFKETTSFSEIKDVDPRAVWIEWEPVEKSRLLNSKEAAEAVRKTESLLRQFWDVLTRKNKNFNPIFVFRFAEVYGWPFAPVIGQSVMSLNSLKNQLYSALTIRGMLERSYPNHLKTLQDHLRGMKALAKELGSKDASLESVYPGELVISKRMPTFELRFDIRYDHALRAALEWDICELECDKSFTPQNAYGDLAKNALTSVMQYLARRNIVWNAVGKETFTYFSMEIPCPVAYCLLQLNRPGLLNDLTSDKKSSKKPYPQASQYFRRWKDRGHISEETYQAILAELKELKKKHPEYTAARLKNEIAKSFNLDGVK